MSDVPEITVDIEKVAYGALGIARHEGQTIFVPGAIPGDRVVISIESDKGRYAHAKLISYAVKSPLTQKPSCAYESCGGCQWQHASYREQLSWKGSFVADAFERIGKIPLPIGYKVLPSPTELNYRNRVLLRGTVHKDGSVGVGFFKKATKEQVHIDRCMIARPILNRVIEQISRLNISVKPQKFRMELQEFEALSEQTAQVSVVVHPVLKHDLSLEKLVEKLGAFHEVIWSGLSTELKNPPFIPLETYQGLSYFSAPGQFFQVNLAHNRQLREFVQQEVTKDEQANKILDLFCGSGNLSLGLAAAGKTVFGVEANPIAIKAANYAVTYNRIENCTYKTGDALKYLSKSCKKQEQFDVVLVDPPRAGMKEGMSFLRAMTPKKIIYVSCDPNTLARDLRELKDDYHLESVTSFDFFPHTYHVETAAVLQLKS
ncbi:MAG: class I SAM-dependent RNA methyltransferase [Oligoflexales bacterium]|nr:class I SAM-dependent RNA methyltransferase [Oligoflexales bacterium]